MTEQQLNGADVGPGLKQMDCEGMPQAMRRDGLGESGETVRLLTGVPNRIPGDRLASTIAREEPILRPRRPPIVAQNRQQRGREHHVTIFLPFALLHANDHSSAVDSRRRQMNRFRDAKACGVAGGQDRAVLEVSHKAEELLNFLGTEDNRQRLRLLGKWEDVLVSPVLFERHPVQEAKRRYGGVYRTGRQLLLAGQMDLVGANFLFAQFSRGFAEVASKAGDLLDV